MEANTPQTSSPNSPPTSPPTSSTPSSPSEGSGSLEEGVIAESPQAEPGTGEPLDPRQVSPEDRDGDGNGLLESVTDAIERLAELDPADAAAPGAAIADVLSQALEEEER